jgi:hypothetical protein
MQTLPDYHLDALFRAGLDDGAETLAASAAGPSEMLERVGRVLARRRTRRQHATLLLAAALTTLTAATIALGGSPLTPPVIPEQSSEASASEEPVNDWPDTTENQAGAYSWDGSACGMSCNQGFMHNGYGSNDLEIRIAVLDGGVVPDDAAEATTVGGHDGIYRRVAALREEWIVEIEGTVIAIHLTVRSGVSDADLAEAHAIIDSMRTEAADNDLGFRLIFTLTTDDWDSG